MNDAKISKANVNLDRALETQVRLQMAFVRAKRVLEDSESASSLGHPPKRAKTSKNPSNVLMQSQTKLRRADSRVSKAMNASRKLLMLRGSGRVKIGLINHNHSSTYK